MKKMESAPKVKDVSRSQSEQMNLRSHVKSPLHSEAGSMHGKHSCSELNQCKHMK
jgi:hypothetical protein